MTFKMTLFFVFVFLCVNVFCFDVYYNFIPFPAKFMGDEKPPQQQYYPQAAPQGYIPQQQQPVALGQVAGSLKTIYPLSNFDRLFKN